MDLAPARLEKRFSGGIEMNRTTLTTLLVAGLALAAASCSASDSSPVSGAGGNGAGGGSHAGGAGTTAAGGGSAAGGAGAAGGATAVLTPDAFGQKFKFADNELPGWTQTPADQDPAAFDVYTSTDDLVSRIDGAADAYDGFRVAVFQDLMGPDPQTCNVVTMDFVTDAKATEKFTYQQDNGASTPIPNYDASVAIASTNLTGINVYAHFNALYFELQMSGYLGSDQNLDLNKATSAAAQFLAVLKTKSN
jgi:hypothetical protein